ncbi:glycosyltransferase [Methylorubrum extorquens]|uniref:glycosyltransferase n=1 Tax=Methylorubrum extorquens TaxID=408 RepID=UPI0020A0560B|nr:glycosyltransferase [Methylorubrum extorquens]MCP1538095.1 GT2 family glycosyltransferase [Methylorubrum extorquens]
MTSAKDRNIIYWRQNEVGTIQNFGDYLSEIIAQYIVAGPIAKATTYRIVGSCIANWLIKDDLAATDDREQASIAFWCCGVRDEVPLDPEVRNRCSFFGVRGPLSRDILELPSDTVLGDTGLLIPLIYNARRSKRTAGRTVCIPHINDTKSERHLQQLSMADEIVFPNISASEDETWSVIDDIASASFVLCGALHAAVISYAYRVPFAFWDNGHVDLPLKWRDFAASIGIPCVFVRSIEEGQRAYESMIAPNIRQLSLTPILATAPFKIRPDIINRAYVYDGLPMNFDDSSKYESIHSVKILVSSEDLMATNGDLRFQEARKRFELLENIAESNLKERDHLTNKLREAESDQDALRTRLVDLQASFNSLAQSQGESALKLGELVRSIELMRSGMQSKAQLAEAEAEADRDGLRRRLAQSESEHYAMQDRLVRSENERRETIQHLEASRLLEQALRIDLAAGTAAAQAVEQELRTQVAAATIAAQAVEQELRNELAAATIAAQAVEQELRNELATATIAAQDDKRFAELKHNLLREFVDAARAVQGRMERRDRESALSLPDLAPGSVVCEALFFDEAFYLRQIAHRQTFLGQDYDPGAIERAGLAHYLSAGWLQGLSPSPLFDNDWYLVRHGAVVPPDMNPLTHYVRYGAADGLQPHPCFDRHYYLSHYPEAARHQPDVYQHFVRQGLFQGCFPSAAVAEVAREGQTALDVLSALLEERLGDSDASSEAAGTFWPPRPMDDYWLPQALRDYVLDTFGNEPVATLSYLMSVITQYEAAPEAFGASHAAAVLAARIRERAAAQVKRQSDAPLAASIIIPVHNNCLYTLTCLASIFEYAGERSFEIIVGDDSSTDETYALIEALEGNVRIVRHTPNKGFLGNCNACAATARGDVLVFLNNDTIVLPDWLDALIEPLDRSDIGLSGSKLINGDGTLQEAGGILWRDGSAWNFGRGDDPRLPTYSYRKDVDYCSGASIAITADLWQRLDGFDTEFTPAYCEDSDLALRVRAAGLRTILEPFSLVIHHEGRSHGRSLDMGLKAFQVVNQEKLFSRWQGTFADENLPNAQDVFLARDRSRSKPHILVVDHYIPQWDHDAGSRTMFHFIRAFLAAGFHVTFWPDNLFRTPDYARRLQQMGVEVIYGPQFVNGLAKWYGQVADHLPYVLLSRPHVAPMYIDVFDRTKTKVLYYGHDLHWKRLEAEYGVTGQPSVLKEMNKLKAQEIALCEDADVALYPSADEVAVLRVEASRAIKVVDVPAWYFDRTELGRLDHALSQGLAREGRHILFVGGFQHSPNVDGMLWFMNHVWPLVTARDPAVRITIAGSNPPEAIRRYAWMSPYVTVTGFVSDEALDRLYAEASVAIVPLRFGGGVKGKLIEAFSKGIPVVSTPTGVQGIADGAHIACVAEEAEAFAEQVLACLKGGEPITRKVRAAAEFLGENYSARALVERLQPFMPELRSEAAW